jgi:hypothetical protein
MIQSLVSFSQDRFGFEKPPSLFLNSDSDNATNLLGKTAYYDPENQEVHVYTTDRHPKDIMRSISHLMNLFTIIRTAKGILEENIIQAKVMLKKTLT